MTRLFATIFMLLATSVAHASLGQFLFESNRTMEAWMAGVDEQTVTVNGVAWHYYARNTDQPRCTVLLHGFTAEASHWFRFARHLEKSRCLIIPDLPGFGQSSFDMQGDYSIPTQATRLRDFLDTVKPQSKLDLVGSSMGGHISTYFTLENPQRIATLTLFDGGGVEASSKSYSMQVLENTGHPVFYVTDHEAFYRLMASTMSDAPWMPGVVMDYLADEFIERNDRHMHIFDQIHGKDKLDARVAQIKAPTLIVWGDEDKILDKSMGERYGSLIPGSRLDMLNGIGHLPFLEIPGKSAELWLGFMQGK